MYLSLRGNLNKKWSPRSLQMLKNSFHELLPLIINGGLRFRSRKNSLNIGLLPTDVEVIITYVGKIIKVFVDTSTFGPGFHEVIIEVFTRFGEDIGIDWIVNDQNIRAVDPSGYWIDRNSDALKRYYLKALRKVVDEIDFKKVSKEYSLSFMMNSNKLYLSQDCEVIAPLGELTISDLKKARKEDDALEKVRQKVWSWWDMVDPVSLYQNLIKLRFYSEYSALYPPEERIGFLVSLGPLITGLLDEDVLDKKRDPEYPIDFFAECIDEFKELEIDIEPLIDIYKTMQGGNSIGLDRSKEYGTNESFYRSLSGKWLIKSPGISKQYFSGGAINVVTDEFEYWLLSEIDHDTQGFEKEIDEVFKDIEEFRTEEASTLKLEKGMKGYGYTIENPDDLSDYPYLFKAVLAAEGARLSIAYFCAESKGKDGVNFAQSITHSPKANFIVTLRK